MSASQLPLVATPKEMTPRPWELPEAPNAGRLDEAPTYCTAIARADELLGAGPDSSYPSSKAPSCETYPLCRTGVPSGLIRAVWEVPNVKEAEGTMSSDTGFGAACSGTTTVEELSVSVTLPLTELRYWRYRPPWSRAVPASRVFASFSGSTVTDTLNVALAPAATLTLSGVLTCTPAVVVRASKPTRNVRCCPPAFSTVTSFVTVFAPVPGVTSITPKDRETCWGFWVLYAVVRSLTAACASTRPAPTRSTPSRSPEMVRTSCEAVFMMRAFTCC